MPLIKSVVKSKEFSFVVISHPISRYQYIDELIETTYLEEFEYFENPEIAVNDIINEFQPDIIITGSSPPSADEKISPEQFFYACAKTQNIRTVAVLDAWERIFERFSVDNLFCEELVPDILCVMDKLAKQQLVGYGIDKDRIIITHNPYADRVVLASKNKIREKISDDLSILFISQPLKENRSCVDWGYTQETLFSDLLLSIKNVYKNKNVRICIWQHPKERESQWKEKDKLSVNNNIKIFLAKNKDLSLLGKVDFVASSHSTLMYEALYYGTPCLSLRIGSSNPMYLVSDELGLSDIILNNSQLESFLSNTDFSIRRKAVLQKKHILEKEEIFFSNGNGTNQVLDVIRNLIL